MSRAAVTLDDDLAEEVADFLRANPTFLAERPELYRVLTPPQRIHGEPLADHMAAMIRVERAHAAAMASRADGVLAAGRAAAGLAGRVQEAVVALLRAADPLDWIGMDLPGLLGLDAASLCLPRSAQGARTVPAATIKRLLGGRDVVFRQAPSETRLLHGEAAALARTDALVRVPLDSGEGLLALASRDRRRLHAEQGSGPLVFLARSLAAALERLV